VSVSVGIFIFELGYSMALSALKAIASDGEHRVIGDLKEAAVKNYSLIVYRHSEGDLRDHLFKDSL
jgi:hypothetical protein